MGKHMHRLCQYCYEWAIPDQYFTGTREGTCCSCGEELATVIRVHSAYVIIADNERMAAAKGEPVIISRCA